MAGMSTAEDERVFSTGYCDIHYTETAALSDFFWRISGRRFDFTGDVILARSRVDRLVERVQDILDMRPEGLRIRIDLFARHEKGMIAAYYKNTNSIKIYADKVTDGIFAHELAHAVICNYFDAAPPGKMQEILTQYVDKHLWDDY